MNFNDLLVGKGFDPEGVLVLRHRPNATELKKALPWLASEKPNVFNAYQQTQGQRVEQAMLATKYVASFIGHQPGEALFVGLYKVGKTKPITREQYWNIPAYQELRRLGMRGFAEEAQRSSVLWFDLALSDFYADWKGKLVVFWPPPERAWWRRAHRNTISVLAIHDQSILHAVMPKWDEMVVSWEGLRQLPARWRASLSEWRGIYYIFDESDGKGYVGSAYGHSNILGRWRRYAATGHGGNSLLRHRNPAHFRFSILQRVSPDVDADDVIRLESAWKDRLHTRAPQGLNDN